MFSFSYIKLAIAVALFAAGAYSGWYVMSGQIAKLELEYETERRVAAEGYALAQQQNRETESAWRADVAAREAAYQEARALRDSRIASLNATNGQLLNRITTLAGTGNPATNSSTTIGDLQKRIEVLGTLVGELDGFAGQVAQVADTLREELSLCRNYAKALHDTPSL